MQTLPKLLSRVSLVAALALVAGFAVPIAHAEKLKNGTFVVILDGPIGTKTSKQGDTFTARVVEPANYAGATVEGKVTKVVPAVAGSGKAQIAFGFSTITLADNTTFKIVADLKDITGATGMAKVDAEGQAISLGNGAKRALMTAGGAGTGALIGGLLGGGLGSLIGGAVGAGAGFFVAHEVTAGGQNMDFDAGTRFTIEVNKSAVDNKADANAIHAEEAATLARSQQAAPSAATQTAGASAAAAAATPATATVAAVDQPTTAPATTATPAADGAAPAAAPKP